MEPALNNATANKTVWISFTHPQAPLSHLQPTAGSGQMVPREKHSMKFRVIRKRLVCGCWCWWPWYEAGPAERKAAHPIADKHYLFSHNQRWRRRLRRTALKPSYKTPIPHWMAEESIFLNEDMLGINCSTKAQLYKTDVQNWFISRSGLWCGVVGDVFSSENLIYSSSQLATSQPNRMVAGLSCTKLI